MPCWNLLHLTIALRRMFPQGLLLLVLCVQGAAWENVALASPLAQVIRPEAGPLEMATQACVLEAPFTDPNQLDLTHCRLWGKPYLNLSDSRKPTWAWMRVKNTDAWPQQMVLLLNIQLHNSRLFVQGAQEGRFVELVPPPAFRQGRIAQQRFAVAGNETLDLLVFTEGESYVCMPLLLFTNSQFTHWLAWNYFKNALYYGALGIMFLFQLYLLFSLRERLYFYYLLTIPAAIALQMGLDGLVLEFSWFDGFNIYTYCAYAAWATGVAACLFAKEFLQLRSVKPWESVLHWLLAIYSFIIPASFALEPFWLSKLASASAFLLGLVLWSAGAAALRQGVPLARVYLAGWGTYLVSLCWFALALNGYGDDHFAVGLVKVASLIELSLFALALAGKMQQLRGEKAEAQAALLQASRQAAAELEVKVAQRTQELAQANREMDELLSIASHDLRTPLSGILGYAGLLYERHGNNPESAEFIDAIRHSGETMSALISNFLDLSRLEQGRPLPPLQQLDLIRLAQEAVTEFQFLAHAKEMTLILTGGPGPLLVQGWREELRQVLANLISNAIKYSPPGSSLEVRLQVGDKAQVAVLDQGPGIKAEDQARLFTKFARLSNRPTAGETSNGLGLYIAKKLTLMMGGDLRQQNLPQQGSCFQLEFNLAATV